MELETFDASLTIERSRVTEVLRAVILAILFQRTYTTVKAAQLDVLDICFSIPDDAEMDKIVMDRVASFWRKLSVDPAGQGQCSLILTEKKQKKSWFSSGEEDVPWERWNLNISLKTGRTEKERVRTATEHTTPQLNALLLDMVRFVNAKRDHVPLITDDGGAPQAWPWTIVGGGGGGPGAGAAGGGAPQAGGYA